MEKLGVQLNDVAGFPFVVFGDYNGRACCLSASSLAVNPVPGASAIWLGAGSSRMHLTRNQVISLIEHLEAWLETAQFDFSVVDAPAEGDPLEKILETQDGWKFIQWREKGPGCEHGTVPKFEHFLSFELRFISEGEWHLRGEVGRVGCMLRNPSKSALMVRAESYVRQYIRDSWLFLNEISRLRAVVKEPSKG